VLSFSFEVCSLLFFFNYCFSLREGIEDLRIWFDALVCRFCVWGGCVSWTGFWFSVVLGDVGRGFLSFFFLFAPGLWSEKESCVKGWSGRWWLGGFIVFGAFGNEVSRRSASGNSATTVLGGMLSSFLVFGDGQGCFRWLCCGGCYFGWYAESGFLVFLRRSETRTII